VEGENGVLINSCCVNSGEGTGKKTEILGGLHCERSEDRPKNFSILRGKNCCGRNQKKVLALDAPLIQTTRQRGDIKGEGLSCGTAIHQCTKESFGRAGGTKGSQKQNGKARAREGVGSRAASIRCNSLKRRKREKKCGKSAIRLDSGSGKKNGGKQGQGGGSTQTGKGLVLPLQPKERVTRNNTEQKHKTLKGDG